MSEFGDVFGSIVFVFLVFLLGIVIGAVFLGGKIK